MPTTDLVLVDVAERVATVTLNRPEARNALDSALMRALPEAMRRVGDDDDVDVVILTGADPAFCAGLDLKELGSTGGNLDSQGDERSRDWNRTFWRPIDKPVIGAINGAAITGGLEVALQCDFLVASERAVLGDTHAKVGVIPGGGMSVLLPQRIGFPKAIEMSLTGRFLDANEALQWGLVTHVVPHDELLAFTKQLAADIVGGQRHAVRTILEEYRAHALTTAGDAWDDETERFLEFRKKAFDPATVRDPRANRQK
jgi:enoyl-CoA hydratase